MCWGCRKVWLGYTMFPTYHTVMRKRVPWSRLWYGTLLRVTEHQRLGKRRSLRWIQIRWIILHWRWCLPQQNSKVNSGGEMGAWWRMNIPAFPNTQLRLWLDQNEVTPQKHKALKCLIHQNNRCVRATTVSTYAPMRLPTLIMLNILILVKLT